MVFIPDNRVEVAELAHNLQKDLLKQFPAIKQTYSGEALMDLGVALVAALLQGCGQRWGRL